MINSDSAKSGHTGLFGISPHIFAPALTYILGTVLTISVFSLVRGGEEAQLQQLFESSARNRLAALQTDIVRHTEVVSSLASFFSASQNVTREEFRSFVKTALSRHPGIQALAWNPLIKSAEHKRYIDQAYEDGLSDFQITEFGSSGQIIEATGQDDAVVVYYIEPYKSNEKALGFNIASNPARLQAIQQARDTGKATITERITLVQEQQESFAYLLLIPVYRQDVSIHTVIERREQFIGLATGVIRLNAWLPLSIRDLPPIGIDVLLLDQSAPADKQFLHFHSSRTRKKPIHASDISVSKAEENLHWKSSIDISGRQWTALFTPAPAFRKENRSWHAWTILMAGLSFTFLLTLYLFAKMRYADRLASTNIELLHENTERKVNESELKSQIDFIDTVLDAASNIIVVLDLDGRFVRFNRAAEEYTGYTVNEVLGEPVWELVIPEEQRDAVKNVFYRLRNGELAIASQYENDWLNRYGGRSLFQWHNSVLYDENGKVSHIVAMGYDITEKKKAEAEHERLQRELQQAHKMESLGQLTGGVAHDFNNLLGIINGYASLIHDRYSNNDEKLSSYVANIREAGDRAARLVSQMLAFSRSDIVSDTPLQFEPLLKEDIKMLQASLPSSIEIKTEIEAGLPGVLMNPIHLHQILMNLAINARDAMQEVGQLHIKLGWARHLNTESQVSHKPVKGDWIELCVSDTGSGISEENAKNIFNPFFTTKEVGKGTGMGLSVIYGIMESHNGHILLESKPGQGSTFRMLFPPILEQDYEITQTSQSTVDVPMGNGSEILLVDDEISLASYMAELVNSQGYMAHFVTDSSEALALFQKEPKRFSMLITDQTMPKMTGTELISHVREIVPGLPVILCTGNSDRIDDKWAQEMDISFFEKPVSGQQLLLKIAALFEAKK